MKITISGTLGSGKSTVAKILAEKLKYEYYSTGQIARRLSEEKKFSSFVEANKYAEKDTSIDNEIDGFQRDLGKNKDNFVIEGRLGFYFIPDSIKIFLKCSDKTGAQRIIKGLREKEQNRIMENLKDDEQSILESMKLRRESENKRYTSLYGIKQDDESNFDLVIDTSDISPEEVCDRILLFINRKKAKK